jgi:hypothetical protein
LRFRPSRLFCNSPSRDLTGNPYNVFQESDSC